jgi:hypothetical protein
LFLIARARGLSTLQRRSRRPGRGGDRQTQIACARAGFESAADGESAERGARPSKERKSARARARAAVAAPLDQQKNKEIDRPDSHESRAAHKRLTGTQTSHAART